MNYNIKMHGPVLTHGDQRTGPNIKNTGHFSSFQPMLASKRLARMTKDPRGRPSRKMQMSV